MSYYEGLLQWLGICDTIGRELVGQDIFIYDQQETGGLRGERYTQGGTGSIRPCPDDAHGG
jgi:hypothetical protein